MRTTVEIDEGILKEVVTLTGADSKKTAIAIAVNDYLKMKKREAFKGLIGNYKIDLELKSLEESRSEG